MGRFDNAAELMLQRTDASYELLRNLILQFEMDYQKQTTNKGRRIAMGRFDMQYMMGNALFWNNSIAFALLRPVSKEYPFELTKHDVIKGAYNAYCRECGRKWEEMHPGGCIEMCNFDEGYGLVFKSIYLPLL